MTEIRKSPDQLTLAAQRTHLANERTLLAYVRTCLSLVGFGVIVLRFDTSPSGPALGYGLIGAAALVLTIGFRRYFVFKDRINHGDTAG